MNKDKNPVKKTIRITAIVILIYLILDYINIFQLLGMSFGRINTDCLGIVVNAAVVIVLYIITYYTLDKRQIKKEKNSKEMADVLMLNTYTRCYDTLAVVCDKDIVRKYVIPKIDGDKLPHSNEVVVNLSDLPFYADEHILLLAENGYVDKEVLKTYLTIQKEYKELVSTKITFYDMDGTGTLEQQEFYKKTQLRVKNVNEMLEKEIRRLEK